MLTIEQEFAIVIYVLYALDCVHWLRPGQFALVRHFRRWRIHSFCDDSYTLLGRMPVFVNPIDFRPSYASGELDDLAGAEPIIENLAAIYTPAVGLLTGLSMAGATNLLIFLPLLLLSGYLPLWWPTVASVTVLLQLALGYEFYRLSTDWRREEPSSFWPQFVSNMLNPLAALRSGDTLLSGTFSARNQTPPTR
jgi:hypothetical protein